MIRQAATVAEMTSIAAEFLAAHPQGGHFAIYGEMGAGKTTFMRGICQSLGLGFEGSPTFSIVTNSTTEDDSSISTCTV